MTTINLTAVESGSGDLFFYGFSAGSFGSISPSTYSGVAITHLASAYNLFEGVPYQHNTKIVMAGVLAQNFFTSLAVNGQTITSAAATFEVAGGATSWEWWDTAAEFPTAGEYVVTLLPDDTVYSGTITALSGSVTRTNDSGTAALSQGDGISEGDTITTSSNGVTTLTMGDGTVLTCQPSTTLVVDNYSYTPLVVDTNSLWVRVLQGIARVATGVIGRLNPSAFRLIAPQVTLAVRGTDFTVTVTDTGTTVTVTSGTVTATSGTQTYTINAGESMSFPLGASPVVLGEAVTSLPLPAGKYQVAVTYLRNDGQESGASRATTIDLTANGGISLPAIPVSSDPTVTHKAIYATTVGGETLFRVGVIPNADTTFAIREVRKGASPLLTQFLSPPPAGDHIAYANGLMLVAKGSRLYPSEPYAPELFDLRKAVPFTDRITMVAPVKDGIWIGTDSQIIWLAGNVPEKWDFKVAAEYGVIRGTLTFNDSELIGDGSAGGESVAFFTSKRGIRAGHLGGRLINLDRDRFAYPIQERGAGIVRRHRGMVQYLVTLQGTETAGNVAT